MIKCGNGRREYYGGSSSSCSNEKGFQPMISNNSIQSHGVNITKGALIEEKAM